MLCGQIPAFREAAFAHGTAAELDAFGQKFASRSTVNRAVDASAAQQRAVGGIDDGVDGERRDVALDDGDGFGFHGGLGMTMKGL